jgi:allantoate deiminase
MIVARKVPAAMLFLRSPGGLSHHPDEDVFVEDVEAAVATGLEFLRGLVDDGRLGREHPTVREGVTDGDA